MARYTWVTDIHLDHIDEQALINFGQSLLQTKTEGVIVTGDISNANKLTFHLSALERIVQRPIHFVLGNHDYYGGSIEEIRKNMKDLTNMSQYLRYLPVTPYAVLTPTTALIGADGWYDALNGNWKTSTFGMSDWVYIQEFLAVSERGRNKTKIVEVAQKLAHESVLHTHNAIKSAARYHKHIVIATHVPPFAESHIYNGKIGDDNAQPWFTSKMMGDMLRDASKAFPKINFTVLAGHTHGKFSGKITENLTVNVGFADYGHPQVQEIIDFP